MVKRPTKTGNRYDISPIRDFDLALFFGLTGSSEGFDPSTVDKFNAKPTTAGSTASNRVCIGGE